MIRFLWTADTTYIRRILSHLFFLWCGQDRQRANICYASLPHQSYALTLPFLLRFNFSPSSLPLSVTHTHYHHPGEATQKKGHPRIYIKSFSPPSIPPYLPILLRSKRSAKSHPPTSRDRHPRWNQHASHSSKNGRPGRNAPPPS